MVIVFPQAPIENPMHLKIPTGFKISKGCPKDYMLKVNKNVHSQKQAIQI